MSAVAVTLTDTRESARTTHEVSMVLGENPGGDSSWSCSCGRAGQGSPRQTVDASYLHIQDVQARGIRAVRVGGPGQPSR